MALREVFHVIATQFDVEPDHFNSVSNADIVEGQPVRLDTNGYVKRANATSGVIGIAGDSLTQSGGFTELASDIVISPSGGTRSTSNRISDFYNETQASSKMTVYMSGGEFLTDQFDTSVNWDAVNPGTTLFSTAAGLLTNTDGTGYRVGFLLARPTELESGVPGTDIRGSIASGAAGTQFLRFALSIDATE